MVAGVVESVSLISKTIDDMLNFVANDETLSNDFQKYLEINEIELESEKQFNNVIIQYILDMKMQSGLRVLEYYRRNNKNYDEIIDALLNSFCSVFQVEKILSNAYNVKCLTSSAELTLIPMVKMTHLKQIGRYDYIQARILELNHVQYILEIYDVFSEYNPYEATLNAIRYMLINPKSAYYQNKEKRLQLENSVVEFNQKFEQYFKAPYIITTNKKVDNLIECFTKYKENNEIIPYDDLIENVAQNRFLDIEEFNSNDDDFMQNAIGGFSNHKEIYDVALWMDKKRGLYIIPFLETFLMSFKNPDIEGRFDCIKEFLTSDKIPPSVIKFAQEKNDNFFEVVNEVLGTQINNMEELLFNTKATFVDEGVFSPVVVLYNSNLFSKLLGYKEQDEVSKKEVERNAPCPCGSGLKYKNCCGKN